MATLADVRAAAAHLSPPHVLHSTVTDGNCLPDAIRQGLRNLGFNGVELTDPLTFRNSILGYVERCAHKPLAPTTVQAWAAFGTVCTIADFIAEGCGSVTTWLDDMRTVTVSAAGA